MSETGEILDLATLGLSDKNKCIDSPGNPRIGDKMPDGTIFAGISPDTDKPMYAASADASLTMSFNEAKDYAQGLNIQKAYGHKDWRVPTTKELSELFNNSSAIGGFNKTFSGGWYWSASTYYAEQGEVQRFADGFQSHYNKGVRSAVRCVRSVPAGDFNAAVQNVKLAHDIDVKKPLSLKPRTDKPARHFEL